MQLTLVIFLKTVSCSVINDINLELNVTVTLRYSNTILYIYTISSYVMLGYVALFCTSVKVHVTLCEVFP